MAASVAFDELSWQADRDQDLPCTHRESACQRQNSWRKKESGSFRRAKRGQLNRTRTRQFCGHGHAQGNEMFGKDTGERN